MLTRSMMVRFQLAVAYLTLQYLQYRSLVPFAAAATRQLEAPYIPSVVSSTLGKAN